MSFRASADEFFQRGVRAQFHAVAARSSAAKRDDYKNHSKQARRFSHFAGKWAAGERLAITWRGMLLFFR